MYEIIKNVIENKDYELRDILYKINKMYIESAITEEEKTELDSLARQNANAENSYAPLQEQIENIYSELASIKSRLDTLEYGQGTGEEGEETEEYKEYKQPTGAHDSYHTGDKITYNGKKYICKLDNCVWSPDTYPAGWEEVVEDTIENEVVEDTVEETTESEEK